MKFLKLFIFMISVFSILNLQGCTRGDDGGEQEEIVESESSIWKETQMPFNYQNIQVPREVWQIIKDILRKDGVSEAILDEFAVAPVSVRVEISADPGDRLILKEGKNQSILFIEGGGELDLFDFVIGKGPFNIRFVPEIDGSQPYHLLYMSDSPGKEIEGDMWGNGCGRIFDLTQKSDMFFADEGMRVTSSRRQYLHLMAGTFLFIQLVDDRLFLSYIQLKDSRYPTFNCSQK